jgi:chorismate synthase
MPIRFLTAGESHGPGLTTILEGLPAGLVLDAESFKEDLLRRQHGYGAGPRMKMEKDRVEILGGVLAGKTTGAPLALFIGNKDHENWRGRQVPPFTAPRPGHADLSAGIKYGYDDLRLSLERASARETAARVAVGVACKLLLAQFGIKVGGYVAAIGPVEAKLDDLSLDERISRARDNDVNCPDPKAAEAMQQHIRQIIESRDTAGGLLEVIALGLPPGLGSHVQWDRRLSARLGAAVLSIQAMKGVEIGPAFENSRLRGTQVHDAIRLDGDQIVRRGGRSGGLEGGITNGSPLILRAAMKPIATTLTPQETVDLATGEEVPTQYERSDFCPVPRAVVIVEAMVAFVLADALLEKLGGDSIGEMRPRYHSLRKPRLEELEMQNQEQIFWPEEE